MEINPVVIDLTVINNTSIIDVLPSASFIELNVNPTPLKGDQGAQGIQGQPGQDGLSAYEIAVANGFIGNENEWLLSLRADRLEWTSTNW